MGFVRRAPAGAREQRSLTFIAPPIGAYTQALQDFAAGDIEGSLRAAAVWKCCDLISSMISIMTPIAYRGPGVGIGGAVPVANQPDILIQPSADSDAMDWVYQAQMSALMRGNGYGRILSRGAFGLPTQIELEHPDKVKVTQEKTGQITYKFGASVVPLEDVWHVAAYRMPGVRTGLSPIKYHQKTIQQNLSAQRFGNQWFDDGAHPSGILTNDTKKTVDMTEAKTVKERFIAAVHGTREPVVLGGGWQYKQIQIAADESQFLETMKYSGGQICGIYRVPPELVAEASEGSAITYSNVESRGLDFLTFTMQRWISRWERWWTALTPPGMYVKLDTSPLLRTDALTRWQIHHMQIGARIMTQDEIRTSEDLTPLTDEQRAQINALVMPIAPPIGSPKIGS
jgi:HK97 family phage portal protein